MYVLQPRVQNEKHPKEQCPLVFSTIVGEGAPSFKKHFRREVPLTSIVARATYTHFMGAAYQAIPCQCGPLLAEKLQCARKQTPTAHPRTWVSAGEKTRL